MQFEWTSFYSEFATKLLEFKDNRAELIADIQSALVMAPSSIDNAPVRLMKSLKEWLQN